MLDARFALYSAGSRHWYEFLPDQNGLLAGEIRRTFDTLAAATPARVAKGQLTFDAAVGVQAIWRAILEDLEKGPDNLAEQMCCEHLHHFKVATNGVRWADKVAELRREIEQRRASYPADVAKGRLTQEAARQQLERLEAVHDLYWRQGFAFDGSRAELRAIAEAQYQAAIAGGDSSTAERPTIRSEDDGATPSPRSTAGATA